MLRRLLDTNPSHLTDAGAKEGIVSNRRAKTIEGREMRRNKTSKGVAEVGGLLGQIWRKRAAPTATFCDGERR